MIKIGKSLKQYLIDNYLATKLIQERNIQNIFHTIIENQIGINIFQAKVSEMNFFKANHYLKTLFYLLYQY